jgi:hypothetical protein
MLSSLCRVMAAIDARVVSLVSPRGRERDRRPALVLGGPAQLKLALLLLAGSIGTRIVATLI